MLANVYNTFSLLPLGMRFDKYLPCPALQPYVKYFAFSEAEEEQSYKVIPGASLVLGMQYRGSLQKLKDGSNTKLATAGITGLLDSYQVFTNSQNIGTLLVFFTETGASHFFNIPLNELFSDSVSLDTFILKSELELVEEQLCEAATDGKRITVMEQFLVSQLRNSDSDTLVAKAVNLIVNSNGTLRITELSQRLYISQSPLEKRFRKVVGATPKKFSSIIRLQTALNNYGKGENLTELGYTAGYFDQSHFIKDFRQFTGETPEKFFSGTIK